MSVQSPSKPRKRGPRQIKSVLSFEEATDAHPYVDRISYKGVVQSDYTARDANGNLLFVFLKNVIPPVAVSKSCEALQKCARNADLRSVINGGMPPLSGIAGYYDYLGSPMALKCRKTMFTHDHVAKWPGVFPLVDCVNELYRRLLPEKWGLQNAAIPDVVRVHGSVFSTITVNENFRTATHTDNGDFDAGFGALSVISSKNHSGLHLGLPASGLCVDIRPGDLLLFNTHCSHGNTELEESTDGESPDVWNRMSVVLYYRYKLGDEPCMDAYRLRKNLDDGNPSLEVHETTNLTNNNAPCTYTPKAQTLLNFLRGCSCQPTVLATLFAESSSVAPSLPSPEAMFDLVAGFQERDASPFMSSADEYARAREYHDTTRKPSRADGHKFSGGWSQSTIHALEQDICEKSTDFLSSATTVERVFGTVVASAWGTAKQVWVDVVKAEWEKTSALKTRRDMALRWVPAVSDAFHTLAEIAVVMFEVKNGVTDMAQCPAPDRASWWLGVAVHLCRVVHHFLGIRQTFAPLRTVNKRFSLFLRPTSVFRRPSVRSRLLGALESSEQRLARQYTKPSISTWIDNDRFDYQTEDCYVDYSALGMHDPRTAYRTLEPITPTLCTEVNETNLLLPIDDHDPEATGGATSILVWREPTVCLTSKGRQEVESVLEHLHNNGTPFSQGSESGEADSKRRRTCGLPRLSRFFLQQFFAPADPSVLDSVGGYLKQELKPGTVVIDGRRAEMHCAAPSQVLQKSPKGCYDFISLVGVLSGSQCSSVSVEIRAAALLLARGGLLLIKEYNPRPFDHARLLKSVLAERIADQKLQRNVLDSRIHQGNAQRTTELSPEQLTTMCVDNGLDVLAGIYQVPGSALNEYYVAFCRK
ncbi:base J-binding protein 1 B [Diplonema papillatum]|nr:base J-binding protein 1 B [Diplonema papillatum]